MRIPKQAKIEEIAKRVPMKGALEIVILAKDNVFYNVYLKDKQIIWTWPKKRPWSLFFMFIIFEFTKITKIKWSNFKIKSYVHILLETFAFYYLS